MSADSNALEDVARTSTSTEPDNTDITPRSEVPRDATHTQSTDSADGYFAPFPVETELQRHPVVPNDDNSSIPHPETVPELPARQIPTSDPATSDAVRPSAQTAMSSWSVQSTDSTSTVTAPTSAPTLRDTVTTRPEYPNQAYSALQSQKYPAPRTTALLRQRTAQPGQIYTFASALASQHPGGTRAVGNSAPVTPGVGLFDIQKLQTADWDGPDASGTYASPFLHFTHRVPPKETHVADVDVDPISGRKLINHYEIIDELGRGTHGKVKLGRDLEKENTYVAIKIVERFSKRRKLGKLGTTEDKVKKEVAILKQVRHPNVTALLEVIDDPSRKKVYIVLEWVERGQIQWRIKGPREITRVEARRYEREKNGKHEPRQEAEDAAIVVEAQRRLSRQRHRQARTFRRIRRDAPEAWSMELVGDDESEMSEDDKLSRISSESFSSKLLHGEARRSSRAPSPLPLLTGEVAPPSDTTSTSATITQYQPISDESQTQSPVSTANVLTGLEGTMYGAYLPSLPGSGEHTRVSSSQSNARQRSKTSSDSLAHMAAEILDSEIDSELEYVPVMTLQQARVAFRDTLLGLQYLHYQGIIHRDIKPPNLLSTKDHRVKISDFGVSYLGRPMGEGEAGEDVSEHEARDLDDGAKELAKTVGTPAFYAPELCITEAIEDAPPITKAIDIWALGVTLFCMLFARTPFVDNEFVVMRQIAEEEIYIPRKRLKPVESQSRSRPGSQVRAAQPITSSRRNDLELAYEEIPDDLYDLLQRMLVKDPRKRITVEEVRHHPWLVEDIHDKVKWLEETDPSQQSQGKKIEVSTEDVKAAVVPLFLDRVRSGIKKVSERLGFGSRPPTRGRTRSIIGGDLDASPSPSAISSSHASQDELKSHAGDIDKGSLAYRDVEKRLSRSINASPETEKRDSHPSERGSRPPSALLEQRAEVVTPLRLPAPVNTNMATSGSIRTLKQSDFRPGREGESPPQSPHLPATPTSLDSPGGSNNGWAQRLFKSVRERSSVRSHSRASSIDHDSLPTVDNHGEPSLAISQETAAGNLNSPLPFEEIGVIGSPSSGRGSLSMSRPLSMVSSPSADRLNPNVETMSLSRTSSGASVSSLGRRAIHNITRSRSPSAPQSRVATGSSAEEWQRAEDEHIRKLIREGEEEHHTSEPASPFNDRTCPPSPDDQRAIRDSSRSRRISPIEITPHDSSQETSPIGHDAQLRAAVASSTSDLGSAVSISISNPSIPSAISATSSVDSVDAMSPIKEPSPASKGSKDLMSSDETVNPRSSGPQELVYRDTQTGQYAEEAMHTYEDECEDDEDMYDSSSDSDGGLVMSRRRSAAKPAPDVQQKKKTSESHTVHTTSIAASKRRDSSVAARTKESRSGSSNTMKKVGIGDLLVASNGEQRDAPAEAVD